MRKNDSWLSSDRMSSRGSHLRRGGSGRLKQIATTLIVVLILAAILSVVQLLRKPPKPSLAISMASSSVVPGALPSLPWPTQGAADIGVLGIGSVGSHGQKGAIGLASVAKMISVLVIIHDHPLTVGQNGPIIAVSPGDVSTYQAMLGAQDSVMQVVTGEQLSELQALEAMLIPSADNVATMMANWDAGSVSAFVAKMNAMAHSLGMTGSTYTDPSGLNNSTAGTAPDQLLAADALLANPVLAQIVSMPQATLPIAGVVYNVNALVGHDGITGVKTGSTPAGGNFVFSGSVILPSSTSLPSSITSNPTIVGVILGQQGYTPLPSALSAGQALLDAFRSVPKLVPVLSAGEVIGTITAPGQAPVTAVASKAVEMVGWAGLKVHYTIVNKGVLPASFASGYQVGTLVVSIGSEKVSVPITASGAVSAPTISWKLRRL